MSEKAYCKETLFLVSMDIQRRGYAMLVSGLMLYFCLVCVGAIDDWEPLVDPETGQTVTSR